jgi:hypothetical protein
MLLAVTSLTPLQETSLQLLAQQKSDDPANEQQANLCNVHAVCLSTTAIIGPKPGPTIRTASFEAKCRCHGSVGQVAAVAQASGTLGRCRL